DLLLTRTITVGTGDTINGNGGNDIVFGGRGTDTIHGNTNNDLVFGDCARVETAIAGGGVDASQLPLSMTIATQPFRFFSIDTTNDADAAGDVIFGDDG